MAIFLAIENKDGSTEWASNNWEPLTGWSFFSSTNKCALRQARSCVTQPQLFTLDNTWRRTQIRESSMHIDYQVERFLSHRDFNRNLELSSTITWRTGFVYGRFEGYHFSREMKMQLRT